ncbi:heavy metal-binding domain-containing protein [bacterium]|jgi:uncharacterized protein YbjQ (UPF0145 family)|nr:heavy metal-binding domain-containing protein [bacterium]
MDSIIGILFELGFPLLLILIAYAIGTITEKRHYASIYQREKVLINMPAVNIERIPSHKRISSSYMVRGSCVISLDYFKRVLASLRMLVGGRVRAYETLLDRARREATLRMKESCPGADLILNLRLENAAIGASADSKRQIGSIEVVAYGTAVFYEK